MAEGLYGAEWREVSAAWQRGARDRETCLRFAFLVWMHYADPPFLTGLFDETLDLPMLFREAFECLGGLHTEDREVMFVFDIMISIELEYMLGPGGEAYGEQVMATFHKRLDAWAPARNVFAGRGGYGEYFQNHADGRWATLWRSICPDTKKLLQTKLLRTPGRALQAATRLTNRLGGYQTSGPSLVVSVHPDDREKETDLANPTLAIEFLYPVSSLPKWPEQQQAFRRRPSLQQVILIAAEKVWVESHTRQPDSEQWKLRIYDALSDEVAVPALQFTLPLRQVYRTLLLLPWWRDEAGLS